MGDSGHVAERRLGDDQAAVERFRRAREVSPSNPSTLAALERIASRTGDTKTQVQLAVAAVGPRRGSGVSARRWRCAPPR